MERPELEHASSRSLIQDSDHDAGTSQGDGSITSTNSRISSQHQDAPLPEPHAMQGQTGTFPILRTWILDILACFVAVLMLGAIVLTLALHQDKPLPDWPFGISVNALVSIFAVVLRTTMPFSVAEALSQLKWSWYQRHPRPLLDFMKFDDASRGIWGCFVLIFRLRGLHLASFAALISILGFASDPFVQQIIKYVPCDRVVWNETATTARTNLYDRSGTHMSPLTNALDIEMQAAIYGGAYNAYNPITPTCSTGNCTFLDYRTLAMCSSCEDISSEITITPDEESGRPKSWNLRCANITAQSLTKLNLCTEYDWHENDTQVFVVSRLLARPDTIHDLGTVFGFKCHLRPCVRTYSVNVTNSEAQETLLDTTDTTLPWTGNVTRSIGRAPYEFVPMPCLINGSYYDVESFLHHNASHARRIDGMQPGNQTIWIPPECYFSLEGPWVERDFLQVFLNGYLIDGSVAYEASPSWLGLIGQEGADLKAVSEAWANLAEGMTLRMRNAGATNGTSSEPAVGKVWKTQTCISVRWAWLTYPAVLLVASVALLLSTIWYSARHDAFVWKGSPLATLYHGLDQSLHSKVSGITGKADMEGEAHKLFARLCQDADVVELREHPRPYSSSAGVLESMEMLKRPSRNTLDS